MNPNRFYGYYLFLRFTKILDRPLFVFDHLNLGRHKMSLSAFSSRSKAYDGNVRNITIPLRQ